MTMTRITDHLFYGDEASCANVSPGWAVVHACKHPCHRNACHYTSNLQPDHPHYLAMERGHHLYLNLIDPPLPLFKPESFTRFFSFMDNQRGQRPILIHCNKGESRAPSLALLYAAKRLKLFPDSSYAAARAAFEKRFPYKPGEGIRLFLDQNWSSLA